MPFQALGYHTLALQEIISGHYHLNLEVALLFRQSLID